MSDPILVVCRRASDPPKPGSVPGYNCKICGLALRAMAAGVEALRREGAIALCNGCGMDLAEKLARAPGGPTLEVHITQAAQQQMREMGFDPEDLVRKKP